MYLGICTHSGMVYEGLSAPHVPSVPTPTVTQAKLIREESDWHNLPGGLHLDPLRWVFREDSFDPVTRTRRGRIYEPQPGQSQPSQHGVAPHPYEPALTAHIRQDGKVDKSLYTFSSCNQLLALPAQGQGLLVALGSDRAASAWRIIQTEVLANGAVMLTLKSRSPFGIVPEVEWNLVEERFRPAVEEAIERVLDSAFREAPVSVVDHCRGTLTVLMSRWLVQSGHENDAAIRLDLAQLASRMEKLEMFCVAKVAQVVAKFHSRGKPNEQHARGLRPLDEGDAELALQAVSLVLREIKWAR